MRSRRPTSSDSWQWLPDLNDQTAFVQFFGSVRKTTTGQLQLLKHECVQHAQHDQRHQMNEDVNADEPNTAWILQQKAPDEHVGQKVIMTLGQQKRGCHCKAEQPS
ncbi:putative lysyl-tRNA synthetase [Trichinella spiralis]|uniref:putative lysyl-tRNA synthetase n=1 Tax=Trichinella spiralis TaxID=6334 RepID=UPI0001EFB4A2|nr:putative lysyl-tRNA synthetase [Trichinella spiralis]